MAAHAFSGPSTLCHAEMRIGAIALDLEFLIEYAYGLGTTLLSPKATMTIDLIFVSIT